jgi:SpoVK/Ycf46/Vps4 family AAA+-type ATPase
LGWPSSQEIEDTVRSTVKRIRDENHKKIDIEINKSDLEHLVLSLRGLSCSEVERVVSSAIYDDFALTSEDLPRLVEAKRTLLGSAGCLESIAVDFTPEDVGGLAQLKQWLSQRRGGFTVEARKYGLESPRGVLMLGVPGCGKSLCAKVVAADWKMPLLRLDPGVLYQKFIGESESQLRQALAQAEAMAPLILWIDEIEKAFASATSSAADGGLSKRMFGTLLTWMQDHRHPIFIIATANDISALPPELMRKGRFDEVFFIDVPKEDARRRILEIHLRRRRRNPEDFNLDALVEITREFTGSELEQVIVSGLFNAFTEKTELNDKHLLDAIKKTRPLAVLMAEDIDHLRSWAENRCVSAD